MAQLKVMFGKKVERTVALDTPELTIGRAAGNNLVLDSEVISRDHARILWDGQQHVIEDRLSTTGVLINEQQTTRAALRPGDRIAIGKYTLMYESAGSPSADAPAQPEDAGSAAFWQQGLAESGQGPSMVTGSSIPDKSGAVQSASDLMAAHAGADPNDDFKGTMVVTGDQMKKVRQTLMVAQSPHLKVKVGGDFERVPLDQGPATVGYHDDATFRLPGSKWLGKRQFLIDQADDKFYLTVTSWWAKVRINGTRVSGRRALDEGSTIEAGDLRFKFSGGGEL